MLSHAYPDPNVAHLPSYSTRADLPQRAVGISIDLQGYVLQLCLEDLQLDVEEILLGEDELNFELLGRIAFLPLPDEPQLGWILKYPSHGCPSVNLKFLLFTGAGNLSFSSLLKDPLKQLPEVVNLGRARARTRCDVEIHLLYICNRK